MKKTLFAMALVSIFAVSAQASNAHLNKPMTVTAQVVEATTDGMFPVQTVSLSVMKPCGSKIVGGFQQKLRHNVVRVGVQIQHPAPGQAVCLALPRKVTVPVKIFADQPVRIFVQNLAPGVVLKQAR